MVRRLASGLLVACLLSAWTAPLAAQEPATIFATVCATCHGENADGKQETMAPALAGLPRWYGVIQLNKFREGLRGKHHADLTGAQMQAIAASLTSDLVTGLAAYLEGLKPVPIQAPQEANPVRGGELFEEICAKCHRFNGQGEQVFRSAPLTTLSSWYIAESLRKFREGVRGYHHGDLEGPKMQEVAKQFGDQEIRDLIGYIALLAERYPPGQSGRAARDRRVTPTSVPLVP